jgi:hypothetical protein
MPAYYTVDIRHYLGDDRNLAPMPAPALAIALFCGAVVAWVSSDGGDLTNVVCRRSRACPACRAELYARRAPDDRIEWRCPACGESGVISGWRGTRWDRSA